MSPPLPLVVAAPSGAGKTTVLRRLLETDARLAFSVSHTTRAKRRGEVEGVDYHFVSREDFERRIAEGGFLEWAEYAGNLYGTSWESLERELARGRDVVLELEVQGAAQVRERRPDAALVFLLPPGMKALEERLRGRGTDADEVIRRRLEIARREIAAAPDFDYAVVNEHIDEAVRDLRRIVDGLRAGEREALRERFGVEHVLPRWQAREDPC